MNPREIAEAVLDKLRDVELLIERLNEHEVREFFEDLYALDEDLSDVPEEELEAYVETLRRQRERWRAAFDREMTRAYRAVGRAKRSADEAIVAACWQPHEEE